MLTACVLLLLLFRGGLGETNYFCKNLDPQPLILIDQLMGIWYAIEIVNHDKSERHYVRTVPSCPIIYIAQDKSYQNTLYRDYNYNYNYGRGYGGYDLTTEKGRIYPFTSQYYPRNTNQYNRDAYGRDQYNREYNRDQYNRNPYNKDTVGRDPYNRDIYNRDHPRDQYDRRDPYNRDATQDPYLRSTHYNRAEYDRERHNQNYQDPYLQTRDPVYDRYNPDRYPGRRFMDEVKRLRLLWDENGVSTEYRIRYNVSIPGFWISSGPENGSSLDPQVGHFAGTIQVLKAVGNHLVLNFCHQQPDKRYFSVILSRSSSLNAYDVSGVHSLLHRKGLDTNNIKKVCNSGTQERVHLLWTILFVCVGFLSNALFVNKKL